MKRILPFAFVLLFLGGCADEGNDALDEPETDDVAHLDPSVKREIEAAVDGFFGEVMLLHKNEAGAYLNLEAIETEEWEDYWNRLESYELEIVAVTLLKVEPPTDSDPPTAYIGVDADLLVDGEAVSVEAYRLPLSGTPDGWLLTDLPFAE
ncbi:hypothetical protein KAU45_07980 [bacterium]|nr:hypothetical protein [bacterium]